MTDAGKPGGGMTDPLACHDNTMLSDAAVCPRLYYFRHVRGWDESEFDPARSFGSAWGAAAVEVWAGNTAGAFDVWRKVWAEEGGPGAVLPAQSQRFGARTPEVARLMLASYAKEVRGMAEKARVVGRELLFEVRVEVDGEVGWYGGLLDMLVEYRGLKLWEHKSTAWSTSAGQFVGAWKDGFQVSAQLTGYHFGLREVLGREVPIYVDAALVHKTSRRFDTIPISRKEWMVTAWKGAVVEGLRRIGRWREELVGQEGVETMTTFPRNPESCTRFGKRCAYWGVCWMVANPEKVDVPSGLVERRWDFRSRAKGRLGAGGSGVVGMDGGAK